MHLGKTKVMCSVNVKKDDVIFDGKKIEEFVRYVSLRQMATKNCEQVPEINRRIIHGGNASCKLDYIMWNQNVAIKLKTKEFIECILPVIAYGCETRSLSNTQLEKHIRAEKKVDRIMVRVTLKVKQMRPVSGKRVAWLTLGTTESKRRLAGTLGEEQ